MAPESPRDQSPSYQFFMLVLCLFALGALAVQTTTRLEPGTRTILDYADYLVCAFFLAAWFLGSGQEASRDTELEALRAEIASLREAI